MTKTFHFTLTPWPNDTAKSYFEWDLDHGPTRTAHDRIQADLQRALAVVNGPRLEPEHAREQSYAGHSESQIGLEDALQRDSQGDGRHTLPAQDANLVGHDPVDRLQNAGGGVDRDTHSRDSHQNTETQRPGDMSAPGDWLAHPIGLKQVGRQTLLLSVAVKGGGTGDITGTHEALCRVAQAGPEPARQQDLAAKED